MTGTPIEIIRYLSDQEQDAQFDCEPHKEKRHLTQNSYYWVLCTKIGNVLRISKNRVHNMMLRSYGQPEILDGQLIRTPIPDTEDAENKALDAEMFHLKPTSQISVGTDGITYRTYVLMRGSSQYTVKEMSILLDGTIEEAKQLDIETLPPEELERMRELERQYEQKHSH